MNDKVLVFSIVLLYGVMAFALLLGSAAFINHFWPVHYRNSGKITHLPLHTRNKNT